MEMRSAVGTPLHKPQTFRQVLPPAKRITRRGAPVAVVKSPTDSYLHSGYDSQAPSEAVTMQYEGDSKVLSSGSISTAPMEQEVHPWELDWQRRGIMS